MKPGDHDSVAPGITPPRVMLAGRRRHHTHSDRFKQAFLFLFLWKSSWSNMNKHQYEQISIWTNINMNKYQSTTLIDFCPLGDQEYSLGSPFPSSESRSLCFLWWEWDHYSLQVWPSGIFSDRSPTCCVNSKAFLQGRRYKQHKADRHPGTPIRRRGRSRTRKALSERPSDVQRCWFSQLP